LHPVVFQHPGEATEGEGRRRLAPTGLWMSQVARNLVDGFDGVLKGKRYLILAGIRSTHGTSERP